MAYIMASKRMGLLEDVLTPRAIRRIEQRTTAGYLNVSSKLHGDARDALKQYVTRVLKAAILEIPPDKKTLRVDHISKAVNEEAMSVISVKETLKSTE